MGLSISKGDRKPKRLVNQRLTMDDNLLMEVLARVPTKSLIRFRCVSKHWFSLLTRPFFVDFFHSQSPSSPETRCVFLLIPDRFRNPRFYLIDCKKKFYQVHKPSIPPSVEKYKYYGVTNIVNGLVCIYQDNPSSDERNCVSSIYNLTTFKSLPLPRAENRWSCNRRCYLGFDPTNKQYKVLDIHSYVSRYGKQVEYQVLTVAHRDRTWRPINISAIHYILSYLDFLDPTDHRGFCCDGVLYWASNKSHVIVAFNVELETFDLISYPQEFIQKGENMSICQVGGYLSLVEIPLPNSSDCNITLWKLIDRENKDRLSLWTKTVIPCPFFNNFVWERVTCSDFGLLSLEIGSISSDGGVIIDCYHLGTNRRMMFTLNIVDKLWIDGHVFRPSLI